MLKKHKRKVTPEGRKAGKAAKHEDKRRAKEALSTRQQHQQLQREIQYGAEAVRRHERQWKAMQRRIALPRLRADLEYAWHIFEYTVDAKDFTISLLLDELHQAEEQRARTVKAQIDNFYTLHMLYLDQITALWDGSSMAIEALYTAGNYDRADIIASTKDHEDYMKTMIYAQDTHLKEVTKVQRGTHLAELEAENSRLLEETTKLTNNMETVHNDTFHSALLFMNEYRDDLKQKMVHYEQLDVQDAISSKDIQLGWLQIEKYYNKISSLRQQLQEKQKEQSKNLNDVHSEWDYNNRLLKQLRKRVFEQRDEDAENLTNLTVLSSDALKVLQETDEQGTKLLRLSDICRKLETAEEKILPFPVYTLEAPKPKEKPKPVDHMITRSLESKARISSLVNVEMIMDVPTKMENFWNHVAIVEESRIKITNEIACLCKENRALKEVFFDYCDFHNCEPHVRLLYANNAAFK